MKTKTISGSLRIVDELYSWNQWKKITKWRCKKRSMVATVCLHLHGKAMLFFKLTNLPLTVMEPPAQKHVSRNSPFPLTVRTLSPATGQLLVLVRLCGPYEFRFHSPRFAGSSDAPPNVDCRSSFTCKKTLSFSCPSSTVKNRWGLEGMKEIRDEGMKG